MVFELSSKVVDLYRSMGYDLERINGNMRWTLPVPATFVIATDNTIALAYVHADHTVRMEPGQVLEALRSLRD